MNVNAPKVLLFILICLGSAAVFAFVADEVTQGNDRLCITISGQEHCIKYFSLSEMIGFDEFVAQKEAIRIKNEQDSIRVIREQELRNSINSLADSVNMMEQIADHDSSRFWLPNNDRNFWAEIFSHWERLSQTGELYRILHYGDSQIEMDRITAYLRNALQHRFGGSGPGLLPPLQMIPSNTVRQTASENWRRYISYGIPIDRALHNHYGVLGMVFNFDSGYAHAGIAVRVKNDSLLNRFDQLKILTGRCTTPLTITARGTDFNEEKIIEPGDAEHLTVWDVPRGLSQVSINFKGNSDCSILGVALDGKSGIVMDNIPWRGSSGLTFIGISRSSLRESYRLLNVKMVIIQFGGNSVPYIKDEKGVQQYAKGFKRQIDYLKSIDSTLKILVIGPGDMSFNDKGTMTTYPILEQVNEAMKSVSLESGAAFWSMYDAMGGYNSMAKWVDTYPALAAPDYIHFTEKGSEIVSEILFESILKEYEIYRKRIQLNEEQKREI